MIELTSVGYAALAFGVIMPFAISFHLFRMYREKSSRGQAVSSPALMTAGSIIWFFYGIEIGDTLVQLTNVIWTIFQSIYIGFILYYRRKDS